MKTIELEIVDYGYNGEGIAKSEGKVFFVPKTITGEKVTCEIVKENAKFSQCKLKQIDTPSKVRIDAKCPYFADCGGCNFQHIDYEKELEIKKQIFLRSRRVTPRSTTTARATRSASWRSWIFY